MWAVYDVVSDGEIVYVGVSKNPKARWAAHRSRRIFPADATFRVANWLETEWAALLAERRRIRSKAPRMNKAFNPVLDAERALERGSRRNEIARAKWEADRAKFAARFGGREEVLAMLRADALAALERLRQVADEQGVVTNAVRRYVSVTQARALAAAGPQKPKKPKRRKST